MPTPPKQVLLNQLHSLRHTGFDKKLDQGATKHGFQTPFFYAIAGPGLFDRTHKQNGYAKPNGIQIDPVIKIESLP
jgi:hypothetical protein